MKIVLSKYSQKYPNISKHVILKSLYKLHKNKLNNISTDSFFDILKYLHISDIDNLSLTNKRIRKLTKKYNNSLRKYFSDNIDLFIKNYPKLPLNKHNFFSLKLYNNVTDYYGLYNTVWSNIKKGLSDVEHVIITYGLLVIPKIYPDYFDKLTNLELHYSNKYLILDALLDIYSLKYLKLNNYLGDAFPSDVFKLTNLSGINVVGVERKKQLHNFKVSPKIINLYNLDIIDISYFDTLTLVPEMFTYPKHVNISMCKQLIFPSNIYQMNNVTILQLRNCNIVDLPNWLNQLTKLTDLDLSENNFTQIPPVVYQCVNLQRLILNLNSITDISNNIFNLSKLRELEVIHTNIKKIPDIIKEFSKRQKTKLIFKLK